MEDREGEGEAAIGELLLGRPRAGPELGPLGLGDEGGDPVVSRHLPAGVHQPLQRAEGLRGEAGDRGAETRLVPEVGAEGGDVRRREVADDRAAIAGDEGLEGSAIEALDQAEAETGLGGDSGVAEGEALGREEEEVAAELLPRSAGGKEEGAAPERPDRRGDLGRAEAGETLFGLGEEGLSPFREDVAEDLFLHGGEVGEDGVEVFGGGDPRLDATEGDVGISRAGLTQLSLDILGQLGDEVDQLHGERAASRGGRAGSS